jgi:repressor LexA
LRLENNLTQEGLCKIINVSQASLSGYENGKFEPDSDTLLRLASYFKVSIDYLLGYDQNDRLAALSNRIPVLRHALEKQDCHSDLFQYEEISCKMAEQGEHFALEMQDDSMEPRIQRGDLIIFRRQRTIENGALGAIIVGNKTVVKKVICLNEGLILIPFNLKYSVQVFSTEKVKSLPVTIAGQAVELRGKC